MDETLYRFLQEADERSTVSFDKATLTLAGGGLGVSLAFLKDIAAKPPVRPGLLFTAWILWVASVTLVLVSFHTSHLLLQALLAEEPADKWKKLTGRLNWSALMSFILGAIFMAVFAGLNSKGARQNGRKTDLHDQSPGRVDREKKGVTTVHQ